MSTLEQQTPERSGSASIPAPKVSVVIPCLNEAENIEECVERAIGAMTRAGIQGEVVVADNGSSKVPWSA